MVRGDCKKGKRISRKYLKRADKVLSGYISENKESEFELPLQMLWNLRKYENLTIFELDAIKAEINYLANKKRLRTHKESWLHEVMEKCN